MCNVRMCQHKLAAQSHWVAAFESQDALTNEVVSSWLAQSSTLYKVWGLPGEVQNTKSLSSLETLKRRKIYKIRPSRAGPQKSKTKRQKNYENGQKMTIFVIFSHLCGPTRAGGL